MSKKVNDELRRGQHGDEQEDGGCGDENDGKNNENDTSFFYESAYDMEEEVVEDYDDESIIFLTTCSEDTECVVEETGKQQQQASSTNGAATRNQHQHQHKNHSAGGRIEEAAGAAERDEHDLEHDNYEDGEEDEALVETVAMNIMGVSNTKSCFCCSYCCNTQDDINHINSNTKPTNEKLLSIAFVSFLSFTCIQAIAAYLAQSSAMMGDSAAMAVDAFTYAFNLIAERIKNNYVSAPSYPLNPSLASSSLAVSPSSSSSSITNPQSNCTTHAIDDDIDDNTNDIDTVDNDKPTPLFLTINNTNDNNNNNNNHNLNTTREIQRRTLRSKRKLNLLLELIPPVISVTTLIAVTCVISKKAIQTLILDSNRSSEEQTTPNLVLMLTFSCVNLVVDVVNVYFFAKANHALGYNTDIEVVDRDDDDDDDDNNSNIDDDDDDDDNDDDTEGYDNNDDEENNARMQRQRKKTNRKKRQLKQNVIGLAKEKIVQSISLSRNGGAAYSHVAAMDSDSDDEDCLYGNRNDNGSMTHQTNENRKIDKDNTKGDRLEYTDDHMDELCIEGVSLKQQIKAIIPLEGGEGEHEEKELQRQLHLERKNERMARDNNNQSSSESGDQFTNHPLQNNENGENEDNSEGGMVIFREDERDEKANLNMCSAYTHVFADTVRSIAVLIAAILAEVVDSITSEVADAAAAVAVSIIIVLALIPLLAGIRKTWHELNGIWTEEAHEKHQS